VKFKVHVDGAEQQVEVSHDGRVVVGGETFFAKVGRPAEDRRLVQVGDRSHEVRIVENCLDTGILVLEIAGERIPVTVTDVVKTAAQVVEAPVSGSVAAGTGDGAGGTQGKSAHLDVKEGVWAPVPGKIVNVLVNVGDAVEEGAPVVILEAMKMENELHAPKKGTVTAVLVRKGDQAEKGQLLVAFE